MFIARVVTVWLPMNGFGEYGCDRRSDARCCVATYYFEAYGNEFGVAGNGRVFHSLIFFDAANIQQELIEVNSC